MGKDEIKLDDLDVLSEASLINEDDEEYDIDVDERVENSALYTDDWATIYPSTSRENNKKRCKHNFAPILTGKMSFFISIKPINATVAETGIKQAFYKYMYTISLEHDGYVKRTIECKWDELWKLHLHIATQLKSRMKLREDRKKENKEKETISRQTRHTSHHLPAHSQAYRTSSVIQPSSTLPNGASAQKRFSKSISHDPQSTKKSRLGLRWTETFRRGRNSTKTRKTARFPKSPMDMHVKETELEGRAQQIKEYFERIFNSKQRSNYRNMEQFKEFFGLSQFTYIRDLGSVGYEGLLQKRSGGERQSFTKSLTRCHCGDLFKTWRNRWFILRDSFLAYFKENSMQFVMLFDNQTSCTQYGREFEIKNLQRRLTIKCKDEAEATTWKKQIDFIKKDNEAGYMPENENTHGSFAPPRKGSRARWFVCGQDYFVAIKEAIDLAKEEIFIADWWFMPCIELIRTENQRITLEETLTEAVKRGVKIFILVFNSNMESQLKLMNYINCKNLVKRVRATVKNKIGSVDGDIYYLAYPDIRAATEKDVAGLQWAHHEKLLVVDQSVALLGGIDLCIGRYEEHGKYPLFDNSDDKFTGYDYFNHYEVLDWEQPRKDLKRTPWHDIACQIFGESARDLARHFIQRWNFSKRKLKKTRTEYDRPMILPKCIKADYKIKTRFSGHFDMATDVESIQVLRSVGKTSAGLKEKENSIYRAYSEMIKLSKRFIYIENQFFVSDATIDSRVSPHASSRIQNKIASLIAARIIKAFEKGEDFKVYIVLPETAGFPGKFEDRNCPEQELFFHLQRHGLTEGIHSIQHQLDMHTSTMKSKTPNKLIMFHKYISIAAFHKWEERNNELFHSPIYVHSKLMIVDDERCIIGSANINDRSMLGDRDSETAVLVHGREFCNSLRLKIWSVALGSMNGLDLCPSKDEFFFNHWLKVSIANSAALWEAFHNLPNDLVKEYLNPHDASWLEWKEEYKRKEKLPTEQKLEALKKFQGFLIKYQTGFASNNKEIETSVARVNITHNAANLFL